MLCGAGEMTDCPGYVNIKVDVWPKSLDYEPLINSDVLVSCPPSFSVSFLLPLHDAYVTPSSVDDCILECVLEDGKSTRRLLLRPMTLRQRRTTEELRRLANRSRMAHRSLDSLERAERFDLSTFAVAVLLSTSITLTFVWLFCELFHLTRLRRRAAASARTGGRSRTLEPEDSAAVPLSSSSLSLRSVRVARRQSQFSVAMRRTVASGCVMVKLVYSLAFTFTVFTSLLSVALRQRVHDDTPTPTTSSLSNFPHLNLTDPQQNSPAAYNRSAAVSCLADSTIQLSLYNFTSEQRLTAVADVVVQTVRAAQTAAVRWARHSVDSFLADVDVAVNRQRRHMLTTSQNPWLMFLRALYNKTTTADQTSGHSSLDSTAKDAFWDFLHVIPSETDLLLWTRNIHER